eukprot:1666325-Amphidinium_carterae.2
MRSIKRKAGSTLRWGQAFAAAVASACIALSTAAVLPSGEALIVSSLLTVAVATVFASRWTRPRLRTPRTPPTKK